MGSYSSVILNTRYRRSHIQVFLKTRAWKLRFFSYDPDHILYHFIIFHDHFRWWSSTFYMPHNIVDINQSFRGACCLQFQVQFSRPWIGSYIGSVQRTGGFVSQNGGLGLAQSRPVESKVPWYVESRC